MSARRVRRHLGRQRVQMPCLVEHVGTPPPRARDGEYRASQKAEKRDDDEDKLQCGRAAGSRNRRALSAAATGC